MQELTKEEREFVLAWAEKEGIYKEWEPLLREYDKAFILGATTGKMRTRLQYLKKLWDKGIRFEEIVWLTGERPLDAKIDQLTDLCSSQLPLPRRLTITHK